MAIDKDQLFKKLKRKTKPVLLELLKAAYRELDEDKIHAVFYDILEEMKPKNIGTKKTLALVEAFYESSLASHYYAPFNINSKNFSHIPAETNQWFRKLGDLLARSTELVDREENQIGVQCFSKLYNLIAKMEDGEDIVFADEIGSWMIPGDENIYIEAYLTASAKISTPEEYADIALPLIERDSYSSFCNKVYSKSTKIGNKEQTKFLKKQVKENNIRTSRR